MQRIVKVCRSQGNSLRGLYWIYLSYFGSQPGLAERFSYLLRGFGWESVSSTPDQSTTPLCSPFAQLAWSQSTMTRGNQLRDIDWCCRWAGTRIKR